jgi:hypothetical protein
MFVAFVDRGQVYTRGDQGSNQRRARLDQFSEWASSHHRLVVSTLAGVVGIYLLVVGISEL